MKFTIVSGLNPHPHSIKTNWITIKFKLSVLHKELFKTHKTTESLNIGTRPKTSKDQTTMSY